MGQSLGQPAEQILKRTRPHQRHPWRLPGPWRNWWPYLPTLHMAVRYIYTYMCLVQPCFAPFCTYTIPYLHQTTLQKWIWLANVHLKIPKTGRVGASKVLKTVESCLHCSVSGSWPQTLTNYEELLEHWSKRTHSSTRGSSHFHLECGWSNLSQDESQET